MRGKGNVGYIEGRDEEGKIEERYLSRRISIDILIKKLKKEDNMDKLRKGDEKEIEDIDINEVEKKGIDIGNMKNLRKEMGEIENEF